MLPVAHCEEVPVPEFTEVPDIHEKTLSEVSTTDDKEGEGIDLEFHPTDALLGKSILFNQLELNDLGRDLYLPKQYAELLASRLNEKTLLTQGTWLLTTIEGKLHFGSILSATANLCIAKISNDFFLGWVSCNWRLFIDSSKLSLKCILLHNGNVYGSIPIAHSVGLKENHCSVKLVFDSLMQESYVEI